MAISELYGTTFSDALVETLLGRSRWVDATNDTYMGQVRGNSSVEIPTIVDPAVTDYNPAIDRPLAQGRTYPDGQKTTILIDQIKKYSVVIDDVVQGFAKPNLLAAYVKSAADQIDLVFDQFLAAKAVEEGEQIGATVRVIDTPEEALAVMFEAQQELDDENIPDDERFAMLPTWFTSMLNQNGKLIDHGTAATDERLRKGSIGEIAGFDTVKLSPTRSAKDGDDSALVFMHKSGMTVARGLEKDRVGEAPPGDRFGYYAEGVHVYGAGVVRSKAVRYILANATA